MIERPLTVITGAASGIGYHLAQGFCKAGYRVCALDVLPATFAEEDIHVYQADLRVEAQIQATFSAMTERFGPIQVLVNNGAISKFHKPITQISSAEFDDVLSVNLRGSFLCCLAFLKANEAAPFGRILNIASTRFHQNEADWEAYGASKAGLVSLTNTLCVSLSEKAITVNAISPGWIEVNAYDKLSPSDHRQHPSGRVGRPEDLVRAALFLCHKDSDFINGTNLILDGGMTKRMIYSNAESLW